MIIRMTPENSQLTVWVLVRMGRELTKLNFQTLPAIFPVSLLILGEFSPPAK